MGQWASLAIALAILAVTAVGSPVDASTLRRTPIVVAVEQASPSVVNISGRKLLPSPDHFAPTENGKEVKGMGTGVVIDPRGYIITNFHVVDGVERIQVMLSDKRTAVGRLVAHDPATDLAVIKIDVSEPMKVITLGTSADLMCGETVIAVGNAYGYEHTVTRGIISALHRTVQVSDEQQYRDLIQTDASINPGNSGGPLLNIDGEMIGINVAVRVGAQGIGFAIPVDEALEVAARLLNAERVNGVSHGILGRTVREGGKPKFVVREIRSDSPAAAQGVRPGDVILAVGERTVDSALDFERAMLGNPANEEIELTIQRNDMHLTAKLALETLPASSRSVADRAWDLLGVRLVQVPSRSFRPPTSRYRGGLRVVSVRSGSPAEEQGIRSGDVLVGIHKWETVSLDNVAYILDAPEMVQDQPVRFFILRGADTLYGHFRVSQNTKSR